MANKQQVIDLHKMHPKMNSVAMARALGCGDAYVRATFYRNGLTLPNAHGMGDLRELGRACKEAGITLADIKEIAAVARS